MTADGIVRTSRYRLGRSAVGGAGAIAELLEARFADDSWDRLSGANRQRRRVDGAISGGRSLLTSWLHHAINS